MNIPSNRSKPIQSSGAAPESGFGFSRNESSFGFSRNESSFGFSRNESSFGFSRNESSFGFSRNDSGAALITVLVIISVISFIVVSLIAVGRNELRTTNYQSKSVEARLAANAGFRDACNLLTHLLKEEPIGAGGTPPPQTLVTSATERTGNIPTRYTFVSKITNGEVTHYPLFTGGKMQTLKVPDISKLVCGTNNAIDLLQASPIKPKVEFTSEVPSFVKTFGMSHLDANGKLLAETTAPRVGVEVLTDETNSKFEQRYSFWIEDLEGYPNLDAVGGNLNEQGDFEYTMAVNSPGDKRRGLFSPLPANEKIGILFADNLRGQTRSGLPAPGLSPQEIFLHPWNLQSGERHPYSNLDKLLAARGNSLVAGSHLSLAPDLENRFVKGLQPYYEIPLVPYNHGYQSTAEGRPKRQINLFLQECEDAAKKGAKITEMRKYFTDNLPEFDRRKGGFPEDYVGTLIANMIDYADVDSQPTVRKDNPLSLLKLKTKATGSVEAQTSDYRGVDSYLPINEFFYRIRVIRKDDMSATFAVTVHAEFWNPFQSEVEVKNVSANFWFVEPFQFLSGIGPYNFNTSIPSWNQAGEVDLPSLNEPKNQPKTFKVLPNSYYVHNFGEVRWDFVFEAKVKIDSIGSPARSGPKDGKAQLQVMVDGVPIDQSGRPFLLNSQNQDFVGYSIPRFRDSNPSTYTKLNTPGKGLATGDFMMVYYRPCNERQSSVGYGTFFGDPFMSYYGMGHAQDIVYNKSSPGSRNHYAHSRPDLFKAETRVRDWPDRGYDEETGTKPTGITDSPPDDKKYVKVSNRPAIAPFRISNKGKYFSIAELGNLHDPVMWMIRPASDTSASFSAGSASKQVYQAFGGANNRNNALWFYPKRSDLPGTSSVKGDFMSIGNDKATSRMFGGGNTLRICRKEHPLFDEAGRRASQLLDLLHVGEPGTDLPFVNAPQDYSQYNPGYHYPPLAADTPTAAQDEPFTAIYAPYANAQGDFRRIFGHLNINTIPTVLEMECLLRNPFTMNELVASLELNQNRLVNGVLTVVDGTIPDYSPFKNGLKEDKIPLIARDLILARPFASSSHLVRVLSESIHRHEALPIFPNDAITEEPVARVLNLTHLTSRHFRIFVQGEVVPKDSPVITDGDPVSQSTWVYEVYLHQDRDPVTGQPAQLKCNILSTREL